MAKVYGVLINSRYVIQIQNKARSAAEKTLITEKRLHTVGKRDTLLRSGNDVAAL